jgi:hypothetical protein
LWNAAIRAGISVRNYGFADASIYDVGAPGFVPLVREPFKEKRRLFTPGDKMLAPFSDPYFRGFDQKLADYWRVLEWEREYDQQETAGTLPQLTLLRLAHDHFGDFDKAIDGVNTVETQMADNDFSLGLIVERIARGKAATRPWSLSSRTTRRTARTMSMRAGASPSLSGPTCATARSFPRATQPSMSSGRSSVLGLRPLGLNDALAIAMADVFDPAQKQWSYRAEAADILRTTQLPIPADRFTAKQSLPRPALAAAQIIGPRQ